MKAESIYHEMRYKKDEGLKNTYDDVQYLEDMGFIELKDWQLRNTD